MIKRILNKTVLITLLATFVFSGCASSRHNKVVKGALCVSSSVLSVMSVANGGRVSIGCR